MLESHPKAQKTWTLALFPIKAWAKYFPFVVRPR